VTRLKRVDCSQPGIARRRRGRSFEYADVGGARIESEEVLSRIRRRERRDQQKSQNIDRGFFRIGSEDYAEQNDSYGLATILKSHVSIEPAGVRFEYVAKSGQRRIHEIDDPGRAPRRVEAEAPPGRWRGAARL
jgi:DNA topoisomerase IB